MRGALRTPRLVQRAIVRAFDHDCSNVAQSAAYSAIFALFPALIVAAALISYLPDNAPIRWELGVFFRRVLPADVTPILGAYFAPDPARDVTNLKALLVTGLVSLAGASGVIATFMEGIRRAHELPENCWGFWQRRRRALLLVPLALLPLAVSSVFVVFGHILIVWLGQHVSPAVRAPVYVLALAVRWSFALAGSAGITALLYHMGTPVRQAWRSTIPGSVMATGMWLLSTLVFGWYVTRFANYSRVYGSLGVGIALLFWLYIVSFSVLCGAEFNAEIAREQRLLAHLPEPAPACPLPEQST